MVMDGAIAVRPTGRRAARIVAFAVLATGALGASEAPPGALDISVAPPVAPVPDPRQVTSFDQSAADDRPTCAGASPPVDASAMRNAGGEIHALAAFGRTAYAGIGTRLVVLDATDPAAPAALGRSPTLRGRLADVAASGAYAYAVVADFGLQVVATSDLAAPRIVGELALDGPVTAVRALGSHLLVAGAGLHVVDVADPESPRLVTTLDTRRALTALTATGGAAFAVDAAGTLAVYDVARPDAVAWLAEVRLPVSAPGAVPRLALAGETMLAATAGGVGAAGTGDLSVIDVRTPSRPALIATLPLADRPVAVAAAGDHGFVAGAGGGFVAIDVSRLANLRVNDLPPLPAPPTVLATARDRLYAVFGGRLDTFDIADPARPAPIGQAHVGWSARRVVAVGSHAYVAAGEAGVHVVELSTDGPLAVEGIWPAIAQPLAPSRGPRHAKPVRHPDSPPPPAVLGEGAGGRGPITRRPPANSDHPVDAVENSATSVDVIDVAVSGDRLFAADAKRGLIVLDITNPAQPMADPIGRLEVIPPIRRIAAGGGRVYALLEDGTMGIVDVADPRAPRRVGTFALPADGPRGPDPISDVAAAGTVVYLTSPLTGLHIVDAADPAAPRPWGRHGRGGDRLVVDGAVAVTTRRDQDVRVFSLANPAAPDEIGRLTDAVVTFGAAAMAGGRAWVLAAADGRGHPAGDRAMLWTLDMSAPAAPRALGDVVLPVVGQDLVGGGGGVAGMVTGAGTVAAAVPGPAGDQALVAAGADGLFAVRPAGAPRQPPRTCRAFLPALANGPAGPKPLDVRRDWRWVDVNRAAERRDVRLADWDGDGEGEIVVADGRHVFALDRGEGERLRAAWSAEAPGMVWGVDDWDGDGAAQVWRVTPAGEFWVYAADRRAPDLLGRLDLDEDQAVRAAAVADLRGDGTRDVVALLAPASDPAPGRTSQRWSLRAWRLPSLAAGWRFGIDGVDPGLAVDGLLVGQVDGDGAREVVFSFRGAARPSSRFPHGWVVDPVLSTAQWTLPGGFGQQVALADVDADGRDEIVGTPAGPNGVAIALFDAERRAEAWRIERSPMPLAVADVAGDASPEIIAGGPRGDLEVFDARTRGLLRVVRGRPPAGGIVGLGAGRFGPGPGTGGDAGGADIVWAVSPAAGGAVRWWRLPRGAPTTAQAVQAIPPRAGPFVPLAMQLDGAGPFEIVALHTVEGPVDPKLLLTGTLGVATIDAASGMERADPGISLAAVAGDPSVTPRPLLADIDADPWPELIVGLGEVLQVLDDNGRFRLRRDLGATDPPLLDPRPVWAGDLDGDGGLELVVAARRRVAVLELADLGPRWSIPLAAGDPADVDVADLDADGDLEIVLRGRGIDVQAWDPASRTPAWSLPGTAWSAQSLIVWPAASGPGTAAEIGIAVDNRLTWYDGRTRAPLAEVDLWRGAERLILARVAGGLAGGQGDDDDPAAPGASPQLVAAGPDALHVYLDPHAPQPAASVPIGAAIGHLGAADVDGDGKAEILVGLADGVAMFRVMGEQASETRAERVQNW